MNDETTPEVETEVEINVFDLCASVVRPEKLGSSYGMLCTEQEQHLYDTVRDLMLDDSLIISLASRLGILTMVHERLVALFLRPQFEMVED